MKITIPYLQQKFDLFNRQIFAGKLPMPPIGLSRAKTFLGICAYRKRIGTGGRIEKYDFRLRISTHIELTETEVEDTLIHEMIHYYIGYNQLPDTSAHGRLFKRLMEDINLRHHRHIAISHRAATKIHEANVDSCERNRIIAVVYLHDGRAGIKVLPHVLRSVLKYYSGMLASGQVSSVKLYTSKNRFFAQYPSSSALRLHLLERPEIDRQLKEALSLNCDGHTIFPNRT